MRFTHFFFLLYIFIFFSCKEQKLQLTKIEGSQIQITDSLSADAEIEAFIKPFREHIQKDLDSVLAYSLNTYSKHDGKYNTLIGNFLADAIFDEANPIFKIRTGKNIDMVFLNSGSIRSIIPKGNISARTMFEIMPFDNDTYVVAYNGDDVKRLIKDIVESKQAHAISKLKIRIDKDYNLINATIGNEKIDSSKTYYIAISDYMYNSRVEEWLPNEGLYPLNYHLRKIFIDHIKKIDTIKPDIKDRYIVIP
ncbi:MAG: 5'-nucleotidase [Flavobacteriaceae bacterium]